MDIRTLKISANGGETAVTVFGSGKRPLVMLPGISLRGFDGAGERLAEAYRDLASRFAVYFVDRKTVLPHGYTIPDMAEDVFAVMQALGVVPADVYGVSQGGMAALCLAARHPDAVRRLAVCSAQLRTTEKMKESAAALCALADSGDREGIARYMLENLCSPEFAPLLRDGMYASASGASDADLVRFGVMFAACVGFDASAEGAPPACPVLVMGSERDNIVGVGGSCDIARWAGCEPCIYNGYSHAVYDEAEDVKSRLLAFFEEEENDE